jgi:hypothetical protein
MLTSLERFNETPVPSRASVHQPGAEQCKKAVFATVVPTAMRRIVANFPVLAQDARHGARGCSPTGYSTPYAALKGRSSTVADEFLKIVLRTQFENPARSNHMATIMQCTAYFESKAVAV